MYDKCRSLYIEKIMKEFKLKKLKLRNNKVVTDKKQALAIAINMAMRKCIPNKQDFEKIEKKIMMFLLGKHRKDSLPLTDVIETRMLIKLHIKNKKKAQKLYMLLVERITKAALMKIKINNHIWDELNIIQKMLRV